MDAGCDFAAETYEVADLQDRLQRDVMRGMGFYKTLADPEVVKERAAKTSQLGLEDV